MTEPSRYLPLRVPTNLYTQVKALADAETGTNVSMMGRTLLTEALNARTQRTRRTQPREPQPTNDPRPQTPTALAKPLTKAQAQRQIREARYT